MPSRIRAIMLTSKTCPGQNRKQIPPPPERKPPTNHSQAICTPVTREVSSYSLRVPFVFSSYSLGVFPVFPGGDLRYFVTEGWNLPERSGNLRMDNLAGHNSASSAATRSVLGGFAQEKLREENFGWPY